MIVKHVVSVSGGKDSLATLRCIGCERHLAPDLFYAAKTGRGGKQPRCKACSRIVQQELRAKRRDEGLDSYEQRHYLKRRIEVLTHYSGGVPKCACCGETILEFLAVDHIEGGGNKHRASLRAAGTNLYRWLRNHGMPPGYRVLCHNCNQAIGHWGRCPHEKERA